LRGDGGPGEKKKKKKGEGENSVDVGKEKIRKAALKLLTNSAENRKQQRKARGGGLTLSPSRWTRSCVLGVTNFGEAGTPHADTGGGAGLAKRNKYATEEGSRYQMRERY